MGYYKLSTKLGAKLAFMFTENRNMVSAIFLEALFSFHIKISFSFTYIVIIITISLSRMHFPIFMNRASQFTILGLLEKVLLLYSFSFTL